MHKKKQTDKKKTWRVYVRWFVVIPVLAVMIGVVLAVRAWFAIDAKDSKEDITYGVTFSTKYSTELGIDWRAAYLASLDDLGIRLYRIPVYWDEIEQERCTYALDDLQWMMDEAALRNARVVLAVGERVPRWPECHPPEWAEQLPRIERHQEELRMMEMLVQRFKDHPALYRWQVENEPFFRVFGECPLPNETFITEAVKRVKEIDPLHPIMLTDSGELSTWLRAADYADVLGVSMYRTTWNSVFGYFHYPLAPSYYTKKAALVDPLVDDVVISELQTEPWVPAGMFNTPLEEQFHSMNPKKFRYALEYAHDTGFSEVYVWGVEWWYWLKVRHNYPDMWEAAQEHL